MDKEAVVAKMIEMFGEDKIADPEVFPATFANQVKLAKYEIELNTTSTQINQESHE